MSHIPSNFLLYETNQYIIVKLILHSGVTTPDVGLSDVSQELTTASLPNPNLTVMNSLVQYSMYY